MCHPKHIHSDRVSELSWAGYCILCTAVLKHAVRPISVCFSGWNTDVRSRRKFPYQRWHWYNSGCFPSNFSKWLALNSAAVLFFLIKSSRRLGTWSWSNAFASHLIRPPAIWESPFHWRGGGAFYPIPQSHFCSERNVPFLDVSRTCTHTDTFSQMVSTLLSFYSQRLRSCIFTSY